MIKKRTLLFHFLGNLLKLTINIISYDIIIMILNYFLNKLSYCQFYTKFKEKIVKLLHKL